MMRMHKKKKHSSAHYGDESQVVVGVACKVPDRKVPVVTLAHVSGLSILQAGHEKMYLLCAENDYSECVDEIIKSNGGHTTDENSQF